MTDINLLLNITFYTVGVFTTMYYFYKGCWWVGKNKLAPLMLKVLYMKYTQVGVRWIIDTICKLLRHSYIIKQDGNVVFESKSFCEACDKWDILSDNYNWKELLLVRKYRGKEKMLRGVCW